MGRLQSFLIVIIVLVALLLSGCSQQPEPPGQQSEPSPTATASTPPSPTGEQASAEEQVPPAAAGGEGQALIMAMPVSPRLLDPDDLASMSIAVYDLMFNKLVRVSAESKLVSDLAESWEVVEPRTWRFHLREGVKFHNGEAFDAEDVKFTIEWDMMPENNRLSRLGGVQQVEKVEVVDKYTVDITTKEPVGTLAAWLSRVYMLPNEYYSKVGAEAFNGTPVGTGPFQLTEWRRDELIKLAAYDGYWEGRPSLNEVEIRIIPEASSRAAALRAGEVDLIYDTFPEFVDGLKQDGFVVTSVPIGQAHLYGFGRETQRAEPLKDRRVRQAIQYAIDTDAIVEAVSQGLTRKLDGQLAPPNAVGYTPNVQSYPYDPEKARQLLAEAGYANGFTIPLKSTAGRVFKDKEATEAVVAYLAEVGITAEVEWLESSVWAERYLSNTLDQGGMWTGSWVVMPPMDVAISYNQLPCEMPRKFWCNERYDELYRLQDAEADPEKRAEYLAEMAQIIHDEAIIYFVYQVPYIYSYRPGVQGVVFYENGTINLSNATIR